MICKVCGRTIANEEANFCEYCGSSFREMKQTQDMNAINSPNPVVGENGQIYQQNQPNSQGQSSMKAEFQQELYQRNMQNNSNNQPISFWNWLGTMLLPAIPVIGSITYIVLLFVWAFGKDSNPNKKNWARAKLVMTLVSIIAIIIFISYAVGVVLSSGQTLEEFVNPTYFY